MQILELKFKLKKKNSYFGLKVIENKGVFYTDILYYNTFWTLEFAVIMSRNLYESNDRGSVEWDLL